MRKIAFYAIGIIFLLGVVTGCKTTREAKKKKPLEEVTTETKIKIYAIEILDNIQENNAKQFNTLTLKFSADYQDANMNESFSGQIRIVKDSCVWISVTKLGFEIVRVLFTQDSVYFVNKFTSDWGVFDYGFAKKFAGIDVNYEMVQAIFTAEELTSFDKDCYFSPSEQDALVFKNRTSNGLTIAEQQIFYNPENYKITSVLMKDKGDKSVLFKYGDRKNNDLFPTSLETLILKPESLILNINYNQIVIDTPVDVKIKMPKNGKQIVVPKL